jgi:hypothetical protein
LNSDLSDRTHKEFNHEGTCPTKHHAVKRHAWKALESHYKKVSKLHLRQLFAEDPQRGERMALEAVGLYLDYSKNRVTDETLELLLLIRRYRKYKRAS